MYTQYENLIAFINEKFNKKIKRFKLTLIGDALEYALPDFESTFDEISIEVIYDNYDNMYIFKMFVDDNLTDLENIYINTSNIANDIAYVANEMFKRHNIDLKLIELVEA